MRAPNGRRLYFIFREVEARAQPSDRASAT